MVGNGEGEPLIEIEIEIEIEIDKKLGNFIVHLEDYFNLI